MRLSGTGRDQDTLRHSSSRRRVSLILSLVLPQEERPVPVRSDEDSPVGIVWNFLVGSRRRSETRTRSLSREKSLPICQIPIDKVRVNREPLSMFEGHIPTTIPQTTRTDVPRSLERERGSLSSERKKEEGRLGRPSQIKTTYHNIQKNLFLLIK